MFSAKSWVFLRMQNHFCYYFLGWTGGLWLGRISTALLTNHVNPPKLIMWDRKRREATPGPLARCGGRVSDDIIVTGFGWFASLLISSTGASNWTGFTQLWGTEGQGSVWLTRVDKWDIQFVPHWAMDMQNGQLTTVSRMSGC